MAKVVEYIVMLVNYLVIFKYVLNIMFVILDKILFTDELRIGGAYYKSKNI